MGKMLAADNLYSLMLYEYDVNEGYQEVQAISTDPSYSTIATVCFSQDEKYLSAGFRSGMISIYRKDTQYVKIQDLNVSTSVAEALDISADN